MRGFCQEGDKRVRHDCDRYHIRIKESSVIFADGLVLAGRTTDSCVINEKMEEGVVMSTEFFDYFESVGNRLVVWYIELNDFGSEIAFLFEFSAAWWTRSML